MWWTIYWTVKLSFSLSTLSDGGSVNDSCDEMFLIRKIHRKIFQNSYRLACSFIKKKLQHRCFPVYFAKLLRAPFLQNASGWLVLELYISWILQIVWEFFRNVELKVMIRFSADFYYKSTWILISGVVILRTTAPLKF